MYPREKKSGLTKYAREEILNLRNTKKKIWTHKIPAKKYFGPTICPEILHPWNTTEKNFGPTKARWHNGTTPKMAQDPHNLAQSFQFVYHFYIFILRLCLPQTSYEAFNLVFNVKSVNLFASVLNIFAWKLALQLNILDRNIRQGLRYKEFIVPINVYFTSRVKIMRLLQKLTIIFPEAIVQRCPTIAQNSQENTCTRVSFLIKLQASGLHLYKKETLAQVFSCEFCEIFKNTFFYRTPLVATFVF